MTGASLPDLTRRLAQARDDKMAMVVALVDALPNRGEADALIAPLRPRLAQLPPSRPMTLTRLMFRPLDPVIVSGPRWHPDLPAVPRTALTCLGAAAASGLGGAGEQVQAILGGIAPGDVQGADRAGAILWPAAAAALDDLPLPSDWSATTGLPPGCFPPVCANVAAVLHQATRLHQLGALADEGDRPARIGEIVADAQRRAEGHAGGAALRKGGHGEGCGPSGLATVLAVLLAHGQAASVLGAAGAAGLAALPLAALDAAAGQALDRADHLLSIILPGAGLHAAAAHAADMAALVDAVEGSNCRPALRAQAGRTRHAADQACQERLAHAVQQDFMPCARDGAPLDDAAVEGMEALARDLRRLGRAGRRLGSPAAYDALLQRIAGEVGALSPDGLTRMDRLRLAELLVGAQDALRLVPEGGPG